jgi:hypothetical protein
VRSARRKCALLFLCSENPARDRVRATGAGRSVGGWWDPPRW